MKAMICRQWGGPEDLRLEDVERPALKPAQVRLKVHAAGISFATTLVIAGKYQRRPPFPFAPGTEVSGIVIEADPACRRLKVGDEVVAVLDWGGLAEEAVAHEVNVFPKPKNVSFVEAIQLAISYPTSAGALTWPAVLDVQKGQTLLVHAAAGGVGMAAVEIGKILGATVIATAGGTRKTAVRARARRRPRDRLQRRRFPRRGDEDHGRPRRRPRLRSGGRRGLRRNRCAAWRSRAASARSASRRARSRRSRPISCW